MKNTIRKIKELVYHHRYFLLSVFVLWIAVSGFLFPKAYEFRKFYYTQESTYEAVYNALRHSFGETTSFGIILLVPFIFLWILFSFIKYSLRLRRLENKKFSDEKIIEWKRRRRTLFYVLIGLAIFILLFLFSFDMTPNMI